jgi:hypothetical protein
VDDVSGDGRDDVSGEMGGGRARRPRRDGQARVSCRGRSGDDSGETTAGRIGPGEMGRRVFRAWGGAVTTQVRSVVAGREIGGKG